MQINNMVITSSSSILEITDKCHLNCKHCFTNANSIKETDNMSFGVVKKLLKELKKIGIKRLTISGGEPSLRDDYLKILNYAKILNFELYLFTTGFRVNNQDILQLKKICKMVCVSLDPPDHHHDLLRQEKGTYKKAIKFIKKLSAENIPIYTQSMITSRNLNQLDSIKNLLLSLGINNCALTHVSQQGRGLKNDSWLYLNNDQLIHLANFVSENKKHFNYLGTNLISIKALNQDKENKMTPYMHILSNGAILPWFGVQQDVEIVKFKKTNDLIKGLKSNRDDNYWRSMKSLFEKNYSRCCKDKKENSIIAYDDELFKTIYQTT